MKKVKTKKNTSKFVKLYVPELMEIVESGDEKMCLMMAQLEYWFDLKPDGFYKFMTPAKTDNPAYREGDSWTEEMGMSDTKIANALKPICTHYPSLTAYRQVEGDKFAGKFYCSYYHKPSHQTHYVRNHAFVNQALESLSLEKKSGIFREKHSSTVGNDEYSFSGDTETEYPEVIEGDVIYTENTQENNSYTTQEREDDSHLSDIRKEKEDVIKEREETSESSFSESDSYDNPIEGEVYLDDPDRWQSAKKVEVPFPADFLLTEDMIGWAEERNPEVDVHKATEKFEIYHADSSSKDWLKKWRMWILSEKSSNGTNQRTEESQMDIYKRIYNSLGDNNEDGDFSSSFER